MCVMLDAQTLLSAAAPRLTISSCNAHSSGISPPVANDMSKKTETQSAKHKALLALARKQWSRADLAKVTGRSVRGINNLICGSERSAKGRAEIEVALSCPVWSSTEEFLARRATQQQQDPSPK